LRVRSAGNAYSQSWICSLRKSSTLDRERERSILVFGSVRKSSILDKEWLISVFGNARKSSTLDSDRERSIVAVWIADGTL